MYDRYYIASVHFEGNNQKTILKNIVGTKSVGLFYLEEDTPPFIVITTILYNEWVNDPLEAKKSLSRLLDTIIIPLFEKENIPDCFIVRSSAIVETSRERGNYISSLGYISKYELLDTILDIWSQNKDLCKEIDNNSFAIIIQQYIPPVYHGHMSNERHISRNINQFYVEYFTLEGKFSSKNIKSLTNVKSKINLSCSTKYKLDEVLKEEVSYLFWKKSERFHIEWVWDKNKLWIVQYDAEEVVEESSSPCSDWDEHKKLSSTLDFKVIKKLSSLEDCKWEKAKCVKTFMKLGLPYGEIYILDDSNELEKLAAQNISKELEDDLNSLLEYPIVIRMDLIESDENRILQPRTDTILSVDDAKRYLKEKAKLYKDNNIQFDCFCFLIHRFIISRACALAFTKPSIPKVRIDSTWGIVDGLYYHQHDSFEYSIRGDKVKKLIRCKSEYIDVGKDGKWFSKRAGRQFDWKESLKRKQIKYISECTVKIANYLQRPVTVMFFVDIPPVTGYNDILPWFYMDDEISDTNVKFADSIFSNKYIIIESKKDIDNLNTYDFNDNHKYTIKLRPNVEIIRDKQIVEQISDFARQMNIPIEIDGSVLAHPYYILRKKGVRIKYINPFEPKYDTQQFNKLVRDNIVVNIESKGEIARTSKIESQKLLEFLKKKAIEESLEFYWAKDHDDIIEELADIYEVIRSSATIYGVTIENIKDKADDKLKEKGGFKTGTILLDTKEEALINIIDPEKPVNLFNLDANRKIMPKNRINIKDKTLYLPYIDSEKLKIRNSLNLSDCQLIEVIYSNKDIAVKFVERKIEKDMNQLEINFLED